MKADLKKYLIGCAIGITSFIWIPLVIFLVTSLFEGFNTAFFSGFHDQSSRGRSFDEIRVMVQNKTPGEVERLLGPPNSRQELPTGDEKWIWWNYTYLGKDYPLEVRDKIVHLQIMFQSPDVGSKKPISEWRLLDPMSVSYLLPQGVK